MKLTANYPKGILFTIMGLMTLLVLGYEIYFTVYYPANRTRLLSMKWLLFPHILFATIAFLVGPFQFSSRLRSWNLRLHRSLGKVYIISVLLAAPCAIAISYTYPPKNGNFFFENIVQGAVWFFTSVMAWLTALNRQIILHKAWAARSYGVTFIFILSRVFGPLPFFRQMTIESATSFMWFLLVFMLLIPELLVNGKALFIRPHKRSYSDSQPAETALIT